MYVPKNFQTSIQQPLDLYTLFSMSIDAIVSVSKQYILTSLSLPEDLAAMQRFSEESSS